MSRVADRRITIVWLGLVAATVISWRLGDGHGAGDASTAAAIVLAVAFVKVRYIGLEFMELRGAALPLRLLFEAWVLVVGIAVVALAVTA